MNIKLLIGFLLLLLLIIAGDKIRESYKKVKSKLGLRFYVIYTIITILGNIIYSTYLDPYRPNPDIINPTSSPETFVPLTQPPAPPVHVTPIPITPASKKDLTYISFSSHNFREKQQFTVYSAPTTTSWHGKTKNGGPAYASTNEEIYVAGYVGNWLLIQYKTNKGTYRMGYTSQATGSFQNLNFNNYSGTITSSCSLTDGSNSINISSGTSVTVLGKMDAGIYIEAYVNGQQARGTVPESCISW